MIDRIHVFCLASLLSCMGATAQLQGAEPLEVLAVLHDDQAFSGVHDVEVEGRLAFFTGKGGSVAIVDVVKPAAPSLVWSKYDPQGLADGETVLPLRHHLLLGTNHLHAIDFSELLTALESENPPQNLPPAVFQGAVKGQASVRSINGMVRRGDYIIAACKHGWIAVFDVHDPANPRFKDAYPARDKGELVSPHDIAAWDDYIAVVDQSRNSPAKLGVYRVSDSKTHELLPADAWEPLGFIREPGLNGANRVMANQGYLFVATSQLDNYQLGMIDARVPTRILHLRTLPFAGKNATGLDVSGKVLFAAGGNTIQLLDISVPSDPKELAVLRPDEIFKAGRDDAHDLVYRDGLIYVTGQTSNRIGIIRVNDARIRELADNE